MIDRDELMKIKGNDESDAMILSYLCQESTKLACFASSQSEKFVMDFIEDLNDISRTFEKLKSEEIRKHGGNESQETLDPQSHERAIAIKELLLDPHISITKGRKKDS